MTDQFDELLRSKAGRVLVGLVALTSLFLTFFGLVEDWAAMWIPGLVAFFVLAFEVGIRLP